eukprot:g38029.t1
MRTFCQEYQEDQAASTSDLATELLQTELLNPGRLRMARKHLEAIVKKKLQETTRDMEPVKGAKATLTFTGSPMAKERPAILVKKEAERRAEDMKQEGKIKSSDELAKEVSTAMLAEERK